MSKYLRGESVIHDDKTVLPSNKQQMRLLFIGI